MQKAKFCEESGEYLVAKRNDFIQCSRFSLSLNEYKLLCYCLSRIKPGDKSGAAYTISCNDFLEMIGRGIDNYTKSNCIIKKTMKGLSDASWCLVKNNKIELIRWFEFVDVKNFGDNIKIIFHKDMDPYAFDLQWQYHNFSEAFFTSYKLERIMRMKCKYAPRLYEMFCSYKKTKKWIFEFGTGTDNDICNILSPIDDNGNIITHPSWNEWKSFNRRVLKPAITEINELTDISVKYTPRCETLRGEKTNRISTIVFEISS